MYKNFLVFNIVDIAVKSNKIIKFTDILIINCKCNGLDKYRNKTTKRDKICFFFNR